MVRIAMYGIILYWKVLKNVQYSTLWGCMIELPPSLRFCVEGRPRGSARNCLRTTLLPSE